MSTIDRQLEFAIRFARMNLNQLSRGDWLNLCDAIRTFIGEQNSAREIGFKPWPAWPREHPDIMDFFEQPQELVPALQADVHKVLYGTSVIREDYEQHHRGERVERHAPLDLPKTGGETYWLFWEMGKPYVNAAGSARDLFLLKLMFLLVQDASRVRRCAACHAIFYRVRHQRFCSPACRNRTNTRHFREVHHEQESLPQTNTKPRAAVT